MGQNIKSITWSTFYASDLKVLKSCTDCVFNTLYQALVSVKRKVQISSQSKC